MLLKLGNLICPHAGFAKFIYKILDICSQYKKWIYVYKNIYVWKNQNIMIVFSRLAYVVHLLFLVWLFVGIYGIYLKFDLGPLAFISISFINIAIVV